MTRLTLWNSGRKGLDYKFTDRIISEHFGMSGTAVYVHMYEGVFDQSANGVANAAILDGGIYGIEDTLFLENRSRKYSDTVIELRGVYNVGDVEGDLRQFGLWLTNDTIFVEFHLNDMVAMCGRRLIPGDVVEFPHQRDDTIPGEKPAINKFYVVDDANRAANGYSSTWYPHIWRIKCSPMSASQEFQDIMDDQATDPFGLDQGTIGDLMGVIGNEMDISNAVVAEARAQFLNRNFETQQFWIRPGTETGDQNPFVWAGDGIPPNGYESLGSGTSFPENAVVGDYYLRMDYSPSTLFRRVTNGWQIQEINYRQQEWTAAHRLLMDFLNNDKTTTFKDGDVQVQRQSLSKVVIKPKPDF